MKAKGVVLDIIGTCFSLDKPRQRLVELGAPPHALELWFAQTLRDAFAFSHAGSYLPLKEVLEAELPRTLKVLGIEADAEQRRTLSRPASLTQRCVAQEVHAINALEDITLRDY